MTIISLNKTKSGHHSIESQSGRSECWQDGWIAVPKGLEESVWDCMGYCDLIIQNGVLTGITPIEHTNTEPDFGIEPTDTEILNKLLGVI